MASLPIYQQTKLAEKAIKRSARNLVTYLKDEDVLELARREEAIEEAEKKIMEMKFGQSNLVRDAIFNNR